jgi:dimethylargininase
MDTGIFDGLRVVDVPEKERYAANCLFVNGKVLVAAGYEETRRCIEAAGYETAVIEVSEFRKGWGSLTCLSILF